MILLSDVQNGESRGNLPSPRVGTHWALPEGSAPAGSSPHRPGDANPHFILDDSPGSSSLAALTPLLGLTREEEGDILLLLTIVLTLPF